MSQEGVLHFLFFYMFFPGVPGRCPPFFVFLYVFSRCPWKVSFFYFFLIYFFRCVRMVSAFFVFFKLIFEVFSNVSFFFSFHQRVAMLFSWNKHLSMISTTCVHTKKPSPPFLPSSPKVREPIATANASSVAAMLYQVFVFLLFWPVSSRL